MPPGVPEVAETVSVKVTEEPKVDGLGELVRTEVVPSVLTTWATMFDVEAGVAPRAAVDRLDVGGAHRQGRGRVGGLARS